MVKEEAGTLSTLISFGTPLEDKQEETRCIDIWTLIEGPKRGVEIDWEAFEDTEANVTL